MGEPKEDMRRILAHTTPQLPADKPRYRVARTGFRKPQFRRERAKRKVPVNPVPDKHLNARAPVNRAVALFGRQQQSQPRRHASSLGVCGGGTAAPRRRRRRGGGGGGGRHGRTSRYG